MKNSRATIFPYRYLPASITVMNHETITDAQDITPAHFLGKLLFADNNIKSQKYCMKQQSYTTELLLMFLLTVYKR